MVIDALSVASESVSELLNLLLKRTPILIDSVKVQSEDEDLEKIPDYEEEPDMPLQVYDIWKIYLQDNPQKIRAAYVIISANYIEQKYKKPIWNNVEYRGCYYTKREAKDEIDGYLS